MQNCINLNNPQTKKLIKAVGYITANEILNNNTENIFDIVERTDFIKLKSDINRLYKIKLINTNLYQESIDVLTETSFWQLFTPKFNNWFGDWLILYKLQNNINLNDNEVTILENKYKSSYDKLKEKLNNNLTDEGLPKIFTIRNDELIENNLDKSDEYIKFHKEEDYYFVNNNDEKRSVTLSNLDVGNVLADKLKSSKKLSISTIEKLISPEFKSLDLRDKIIYLQSIKNNTLGFVTPDNKVFIDKSTQSLNTPFHEFYHVYDKIILSNYHFDERAKSVIDKLNSLVDESGYYDKVATDENYSNLDNEQIYAEARAKLIGDAAESKITEAEHGWLMKFKVALKELLEYIFDVIGTKAFKDYDSIDILKMSLNEFTNVMTYELMFQKSFEPRQTSTIKSNEIQFSNLSDEQLFNLEINKLKEIVNELENFTNLNLDDVKFELKDTVLIFYYKDMHVFYEYLDMDNTSYDIIKENFYKGDKKAILYTIYNNHFNYIENGAEQINEYIETLEYVKKERQNKHFFQNPYQENVIPQEVRQSIVNILSVNFPEFITEEVLNNQDIIPLITLLANFYAKSIDNNYYKDKDVLTDYMAYTNANVWSLGNGILYVETPLTQVSFHVFNDQDYVASILGLNPIGREWVGYENQFDAEYIFKKHLEYNGFIPKEITPRLQQFFNQLEQEYKDTGFDKYLNLQYSELMSNQDIELSKFIFNDLMYNPTENKISIENIDLNNVEVVNDIKEHIFKYRPKIEDTLFRIKQLDEIKDISLLERYLFESNMFKADWNKIKTKKDIKDYFDKVITNEEFWNTDKNMLVYPNEQQRIQWGLNLHNANEYPDYSLDELQSEEWWKIEIDYLNERRMHGFKEWREILENNFKNNPEFIIFVQKSLVNDYSLKKDRRNANVPPLNLIMLNKIFNIINDKEKEITSTKMFKQLYEALILEEIAKNSKINSVDGLNTKKGYWITIEKYNGDKSHDQKSRSQLITLSYNSWCTKSSMTDAYLKDGDFHVYIEPDETNTSDNIEDIISGVKDSWIKLGGGTRDGKYYLEGQANNGSIPYEYIDQIEKFYKDADERILKQIDDAIRAHNKVKFFQEEAKRIVDKFEELEKTGYTDTIDYLEKTESVWERLPNGLIKVKKLNVKDEDVVLNLPGIHIVVDIINIEKMYKRRLYDSDEMMEWFLDEGIYEKENDNYPYIDYQFTRNINFPDLLVTEEIYIPYTLQNDNLMIVKEISLSNDLNYYDYNSQENIIFKNVQFIQDLIIDLDWLSIEKIKKIFPNLKFVGNIEFSNNIWYFLEELRRDNTRQGTEQFDDLNDKMQMITDYIRSINSKSSLIYDPNMSVYDYLLQTLQEDITQEQISSNNINFRKLFDNQIQAYYDKQKDKVYIDKKSFKSDESKQILIHELVGHQGLHRLFKGENQQEYENIIFATEQYLMKNINSLLSKTGHTSLEQLAKDYYLDLNKKEDKLKLLEELLARQAEDNPYLTWFERFVGKLQLLLAKVFGLSKPMSREGVIELLLMAQKAQKTNLTFTDQIKDFDKNKQSLFELYRKKVETINNNLQIVANESQAIDIATSEQRDDVKKVIDSINVNLLKRLGITEEEYAERAKIFKTPSPIINENIKKELNILYPLLENFQQSFDLELNQPNEEYKNISEKNPKVKALNFSDSTHDRWIVKYLITTEKGRAILNQAKTKEDAIFKLNEVFNLLGEEIKTSDKYFLTELSDELIEKNLNSVEAKLDEQFRQTWEHFKEKKEEKIKERNKEQRENMMMNYATFSNSSHYSIGFKLLILESLLKRDTTYNKELDKGSDKPRDNSTISTPPILNEAFLAETEEKASKSSNKIMFDYFYEQANYKEIKIDVEEYKQNIFQITPKGTWYKFQGEKDLDRFHKMSSLSAMYPGAWCTKGYDTAKQYLLSQEYSSLYIFYSTSENNPTLQLHFHENEAVEIGGLAAGQDFRTNEDFEVFEEFLNTNKKLNAGNLKNYLDYKKAIIKGEKQLAKGEELNLSLQDWDSIISGKKYYKDKSNLLEKYKKMIPKSYVVEKFNVPEHFVVTIEEYEKSDLDKSELYIIGDFFSSIRTYDEPKPLAKFIFGNAYFYDLKTATTQVIGNVGGDAYFSSLKTANTQIVGNVGGSAYFSSLKTANTQIVGNVGGSAYFYDLEVATTQVIGNVGGDAYFSSLKTATTQVIGNVGGDVRFGSLKTATTQVVGNIRGDAYFYNLETTDTQIVGDVGGSAYFDNLKTATTQVVGNVGGDVRFDNLKTATTQVVGNVGGDAYFDNLKTLHPQALIKDKDGNFIINKEVEGIIIGLPYKKDKEDKELNQDNKGLFLKRNNITYTVFGKGSDLTTAIHEKAHEYEQVLTKEEIKVLEEWSGYKQGTTEFSEAFAKGAEKVIYDGLFAKEDTLLSNIFKKFVKWFKELITDAIDYFGSINELNEEVREVYAKMFIGESVSQQQISELFESNPELANAVYEALGFTGTISLESNLQNTGKTEQELIDYLKKKYPEIKLNITNNPVWEQGDDVFNQEEFNNQVNYRLKLVEALLNLSTSQEGKRFRKYGEVSQPNRLTFRLNTKERPNLETNIRKQLRGKGVTDNQIDFIFDYMKSNNIKEISTEQLALELASNYSYTIEINTATKNEIGVKETYNPETGEVDIDNIEPDIDYIDEYDEDGNIIGIKPVLSEKGKKQLEERPIQQHSELTVNGDFYKNNPDWEYRIQQIVTPDITPSIQNHTFGTKEDNNKIGWFRAWYNKKTGEIHILELQSDLFQKGRDKEDLIKKGRSLENVRTDISGYKFEYNGNSYEYFRDEEGQGYLKNNEFISEQEFNKAKNNKFGDFGKKENQFLQLLNKDNNWVTFFIKSIIQDSAKKGYEKVLFPLGDTASKIEGHTTLEEFKKQKEDRIKELEEDIKNINILLDKKVDAIGNPFEEGQQQGYENKIIQKNNEINQLKQELERVEREGFGALLPIYNFYENIVTNILKKQGYNPQLITDEYGNTWNEIIINQTRDLAEVLLQRNEANQIIGQANIKAMTVLVDAVNKKADTIPHEYAHHYIAWFRDTPIVQEGIKRFGSEEALVQAIGEQVVKQKGEAYNWWKKFTNFILRLLSDKQLLQVLTDSFLNRTDLSSDFTYNQITPQQKQQAQELYSSYLQTTNNPTIEGFKQWNNRQQEISNLFESDPELANAVYEALGFNTLISLSKEDSEKVDKIFKKYPELAKLFNNNKELYNSYLKSIFPEASKEFKGKLFFHGTKNPIEGGKFKISDRNLAKGLWFTKQLGYAKRIESYKDEGDTPITYGVVLNISNPKHFYNSSGALLVQRPSDFEKQYDRKNNDAAVFHHPESSDGKFTNEGGYNQIVVFDENQVHIIGDENDINKAKEFLANQITPQQKQQAQLVYSQYLDSLNKPNTNPILQTNQQEQVKKFAELQERLNNKEFLEGAKNAYESTPDLQQFGTQEQYNDYIARVSLGIIRNPSSGDYNYTSQVKDIVYHGTDTEFETFDFNKGADAISKMGVMAGSLQAAQRASMTNTPEQLKQFQQWEDKGLYPKGFVEAIKNKAGYIKPLLFNLTNPFIAPNFDTLINKTKNDFKSNDGFIITPRNEATQNYLDTGLEYLVFEPEQIHILGSKQDIEGFKQFVQQRETKKQTIKASDSVVPTKTQYVYDYVFSKLFENFKPYVKEVTTDRNRADEILKEVEAKFDFNDLVNHQIDNFISFDMNQSWNIDTNPENIISSLKLKYPNLRFKIIKEFDRESGDLVLKAKINNLFYNKSFREKEAAFELDIFKYSDIEHIMYDEGLKNAIKLYYKPIRAEKNSLYILNDKIIYKENDNYYSISKKGTIYENLKFGYFVIEEKYQRNKVYQLFNNNLTFYIEDTSSKNGLRKEIIDYFEIFKSFRSKDEDTLYSPSKKYLVSKISALQSIKKNSKETYYSLLADNLIKSLPLLRDKNITIKKIKFDSHAFYSSDTDSITLDYNTTSVNILLHEFMHNAISIDDNSKLNNRDKEFVHKIKSLYAQAIGEEYDENDILYNEEDKLGKDGNYYYGLSNINEFIAEAFTDIEFQTYLYSLKTDKDSNVFTELYIALVNFIKSFLNEETTTKSNILAETIDTVMEYLENRDFNDDNIDLSWDSHKVRIIKKDPEMNIDVWLNLTNREKIQILNCI